MSSPFPSTSRITRQSVKTRILYSDSTPVSTNNFSRGVEELFKTVTAEERQRQAVKEYQKALHLKRLEQIKDVLEETRKDNWRYQPTDSLI